MVSHSAQMYCFPHAAPSWPAILFCQPSFSCRPIGNAIPMSMVRHLDSQAGATVACHVFSPRPKRTKSHFHQAASNFSRPARQTDLPHPFNVPYPVSHFNQRSPTIAQANCSNMFRTSNHISPHLTPINTRIQLLIHQPANHHIVSSH